ncbi:MAG: ABC transporter substrate-binding protein, partial [Rectinemataceae bacterium]|nr:ABC transporter substrate-binding protein [Rectinemataceae bacterium]
ATLSGAAILIDTDGKTVRSTAGTAAIAAKPVVTAQVGATPVVTAPVGTGKTAPAVPSMPVSASKPRASRPKPWKIQLLDYADSLTTEETHAGIFAGLKTRGLEEGRDYRLVQRSAHGDMATLNSVIDAAISDRPDLVITTSTPTLQMAVNKIKGFPVVFTTVADGVMAGAGASDEKHLPNFTGVNTMSDFPGMVDVILECFPAAKKVGTLFVPGEVNSVRYRDEFVRAAARRGLTVDSVGVSVVSEVTDAVSALVARKPDLIAQISDNLSNSAFPAIGEAARKANIPLFGFVSGTLKNGAAVVVARDYGEGGELAVSLAVRILEGEDPAGIPFTSLSHSRILLSSANAALYGMTFPDSLVKKADKVVQ